MEEKNYVNKDVNMRVKNKFLFWFNLNNKFIFVKGGKC